MICVQNKFAAVRTVMEEEFPDLQLVSDRS